MTTPKKEPKKVKPIMRRLRNALEDMDDVEGSPTSVEALQGTIDDLEPHFEGDTHALIAEARERLSDHVAKTEALKNKLFGRV